MSCQTPLCVQLPQPLAPSSINLPAASSVPSGMTSTQGPTTQRSGNKTSDRQSLKKIEPSATSVSSAEDSANPSHPPVRNLLENYPPSSHRRNINKRRQRNTSTSNPSNSDTEKLCDMKRFRPPYALRRDSHQQSPDTSPIISSRFSLKNYYELSARTYSSHFPEGHQLNAEFVEAYQLEDELGAGGYGFVMTARDRYDGVETAVKFIIKDKVPQHSWIEDPTFGRLPMEVVLLSFVNHECIVKCLDVFEDPVYFYLVQELHGSPWHRSQGVTLDSSSSQGVPSTPSATLSTPSLSPSASEISLVQPEPRTPPHFYPPLPVSVADESSNDIRENESKDAESKSGSIQKPDLDSRQEICRRPSYDLFECIEQSENKRLSEDQARYVFSQVVETVEYLDSLGISHRDIKDENLVIDQNLRIKLIDFGSAIVTDPTKPRPYYELFFGTAAYASSEILLKKKYQAAPAEVWTLGVLLSYLLAGVSPFPTVRDAVDGNIFLSESLGLKPSDLAMDLMKRCLDPNPETRISIADIRQHPWLSAPAAIRF